jgi:hypothetical protein
MTMSIVGVKTLEFDTCDELLSCIARDPIWYYSRWTFRGQGNKDHDLLPSILRKDAADNNGKQITREWHRLKLFASYADQQGLPVPNLDESLQIDQLVKACVNGEKSWPPKDIHTLMALAQHYGIPTRILDWTRAPLTGLYFAARYAMEETQPDKSQVTLFALNGKIGELYLEAYKRHKQHFTPKAELRTIDVPYAGNPNITAQQGTFTCVIDKEISPGNPVRQKTVDQTVIQLANTVNALEDNALEQLIHPMPFLIKLTAPGRGGGQLLHELGSRFRVNGTSLIPGYTGAVQSVKDILAYIDSELDKLAEENLDFITSLPDPSDHSE